MSRRPMTMEQAETLLRRLVPECHWDELHDVLDAMDADVQALRDWLVKEHADWSSAVLDPRSDVALRWSGRASMCRETINVLDGLVTPDDPWVLLERARRLFSQDVCGECGQRPSSSVRCHECHTLRTLDQMNLKPADALAASDCGAQGPTSTVAEARNRIRSRAKAEAIHHAAFAEAVSLWNGE